MRLDKARFIRSATEPDVRCMLRLQDLHVAATRERKRTCRGVVGLTFCLVKYWARNLRWNWVKRTTSSSTVLLGKYLDVRFWFNAIRNGLVRADINWRMVIYLAWASLVVQKTAIIKKDTVCNISIDCSVLRGHIFDWNVVALSRESCRVVIYCKTTLDQCLHNSTQGRTVYF